MPDQTEIAALKDRITELEARVNFLYQRLNIAYEKNPDTRNAKVVDVLKQGSYVEAVRLYHELYNANMVEAKRAVDALKAQLGL